MRFQTILIYSLGLVFLMTCSRPKPKSSRNIGSVSEDIVFDKDFGFRIDRDKTIPSNALLSFKTLKLVECNIEYYITSLPNEKSEMKCSTNESNQFQKNINFTDLKPDTLYSFKILVWNDDLNIKELKIINESFGGSTIIGNNITTGKDEIKDFVSVKVDLTSGTAILYEESLTKLEKIDEFKKDISPELFDCSLGKTEKKSFESLPVSLKVRNVSSIGFAVSDPNTIKNVNNIIMEFKSKYQSGDSWNWNYLYFSETENFTAEFPPVLPDQITIENGNIKHINRPSLPKSLDNLEIDLTKDLVINHGLNNLTEGSVLEVSIGNTNKPNIILCKFRSDTEKMTISSNLLNKLEKGTYQLIVKINHTELIDNIKRKWLIYSSDWRGIDIKI